jgi:hypothetical protein
MSDHEQPPIPRLIFVATPNLPTCTATTHTHNHTHTRTAENYDKLLVSLCTAQDHPTYLIKTFTHAHTPENYDKLLVSDEEQRQLGTELRGKLKSTTDAVLRLSGNDKLQQNNPVCVGGRVRACVCVCVRACMCVYAD